jgi:hypothetical protein
VSCWVVTKGHIDCLVQALVVERIIEVDAATVVGRSLWSANRESFKTNYEGRHARDNVSLAKLKAYRFEGVEAPLDDAIVYWQLRCYKYQCDECPGFYESAQYELMLKLADAIEARHGTVGYLRSGGEEGSDDWSRSGDRKWGIDSIEEAVQVAPEHGVL